MSETNTTSAAVKPPSYWRAAQQWHEWLGRRGRVVVATYIRVAAPQFAVATPYSYLLVDFGGQRREFMGVGHEHPQAGDEVECVLRKMGQGGAADLIEYGIKVQKVFE